MPLDSTVGLYCLATNIWLPNRITPQFGDWWERDSLAAYPVDHSSICESSGDKGLPRDELYFLSGRCIVEEGPLLYMSVIFSSRPVHQG